MNKTAPESMGVIYRMPLNDLHLHPENPFAVRDDPEMEQLVDSILKTGVLVPAIARPLPDGGYQLISGHRRKHASELAGLDSMPVVILNLSDDEARIHAGYGGRFRYWLTEKNPQSYCSWGNGSAMRVSAVGWLYDSLERSLEVARATAEVTHNHPEGIKGAEATASAIFLARTGVTKAEIKSYIEREFHYDLSRTCDEIRPTYHHVESCQETVPEAITAFLEGDSFENVIRTAVSLGGDCDTLTAIAGSIAEAFYGVPDSLIQICKSKLDENILEILSAFEKKTAQ